MVRLKRSAMLWAMAVVVRRPRNRLRRQLEEQGRHDRHRRRGQGWDVDHARERGAARLAGSASQLRGAVLAVRDRHARSALSASSASADQRAQSSCRTLRPQSRSRPMTAGHGHLRSGPRSSSRTGSRSPPDVRGDVRTSLQDRQQPKRRQLVQRDRRRRRLRRRGRRHATSPRASPSNGNTVTFHLTRSDPEFLYKLAMPFAFILPADTPTKNVDIPPPGTGPYKWVQYSPHSTDESRAQPVLQGMVEGCAASGAARCNRAAVRTERRGRGYAGRARARPTGSRTATRSRRTASTSSVGSTRIRCTSIRSWRRVLRLQHSHPAVRQSQGPSGCELRDRPRRPGADLRGPNVASTLSGAPADAPGYKPYCPYTVNPDSGSWTGPDMARARQLIEESGTEGMRVKVNTRHDRGQQGLRALLRGPAQQARLRRVTAVPCARHPVPSTPRTRRTRCSSRGRPGSRTTRRRRTSWRSARVRVVSPQQQLEPEHCRVLRQARSRRRWTEQARGSPGSDGSDDLWAQVDRDVTDQAPWVAMFNPKLLDFVWRGLESEWTGLRLCSLKAEMTLRYQCAAGATSAAFFLGEIIWRIGWRSQRFAPPSEIQHAN